MWVAVSAHSRWHQVVERVVERQAADPSAIGASGAIRRAICAGHAMGAMEQAPRNAPLPGFDWWLPFVEATYWRAEALLVVAGLCAERRKSPASRLLFGMLPGLGGCLARVCASFLASRAFRSIPARLVHNFVRTIGMASGHLLGRAPCGLSRVPRDGKGLARGPIEAGGSRVGLPARARR
jgi:hypothetical protein